jgi:hypothetical protein
VKATATFVSRMRRFEKTVECEAVSREHLADWFVQMYAPGFTLVDGWTQVAPDALWAQLEDDGYGKASVRIDFHSREPGPARASTDPATGNGAVVRTAERRRGLPLPS